ncbi:AsnC family protein [Streptomyces sp. NBC_00076]|uniref:AsnC family protein n=1 Tax=Streptomyces sp. NBC_00076 TaxID=2975642 RepID=UPI00386DE8FE
MDDIDRRLIGLLQRDATPSYAAPGRAVSVPTGGAHEPRESSGPRRCVRRDRRADGRGRIPRCRVIQR